MKKKSIGDFSTVLGYFPLSLRDICFSLGGKSRNYICEMLELSLVTYIIQSLISNLEVHRSEFIMPKGVIVITLPVEGMLHHPTSHGGVALRQV